jgi:hypothetical protein
LSGGIHRLVSVLSDEGYYLISWRRGFNQRFPNE